jgi:hypothetical protein
MLLTSGSYGIFRRLLGAGVEKLINSRKCFGPDAASEGEV